MKIFSVLQRMICFAIILFSIPLSSVFAEEIFYEDIRGHWAEENITDWINNGIITGYPDHTFQPDRGITRGEFVTLVNNAYGVVNSDFPMEFKDVLQDSWVYKQVQIAVEQGYIQGYEDGTFRPNNTITRQEAAVILTKLLDLEATNSSLIELSDAGSFPHWSKEAIYHVVHERIMVGFENGSFQAHRKMTRAEAVTALRSALQHHVTIFDLPGIYEGDPSEFIRKRVIIKSEDVILKNMTITGDLIFSKEIANGNATIDQVHVKGTTYIEGGGDHSIHIVNSKLENMIVNRQAAAVRVLAVGASRISFTKILSSATIQEAELTDEGFQQLHIPPGARRSGSIKVSGDFDLVTLAGSIQQFIIESGKTKRFEIEEKVTVPTITIFKDAVVDILNTKSKVTITGDGTIKDVQLSESAKDSVILNHDQSPPIFYGGGGGGGAPATAKLSIEQVLSSNGTIHVLFNRPLSMQPKIEDFAVLRKINNSNYETIKVQDIQWTMDSKKVTIFVNEIAKIDQEQTIRFSVSYKNETPVVSHPFTISDHYSSVSSRVLYSPYYTDREYPIYELFVELIGVNGTIGEYTTLSDIKGAFVFDSVPAGNYKINAYFGFAVLSTGVFELASDVTLELPDLIYKEAVPEPFAEDVYADIGYLSGGVFKLEDPFTVKVKREDGTILNDPTTLYKNFFFVDLFEQNTGLILEGNEVLTVTFYVEGRWESEPIEVKVIQREKTKAPTVMSTTIFNDSRYVNGTVEDWSSDIKITKADGSIIGRSHNHLGYSFSVYLDDPASLIVGEQILVYAQGNNKVISDPVYLDVILPTDVTASPTVTETVYEGALYISGMAEHETIVRVKRANDTVIGERFVYADYGEDFTIYLSSPVVAGETLYVTADGYGKLESEPTEVIVQSRAFTETPTVTGDVYSDFTIITGNVSYSDAMPWVSLKDMDGNILADVSASSGVFTIWYEGLLPNVQYQLTAQSANQKESLPYLFTVYAPTDPTPVPTLTTEPIYADQGFVFSGVTEPYAKVFFYSGDGTLIVENIANWDGTFSLSMPESDDISYEDGFYIQSDAAGKVISDILYINAIQPIETSKQPSIHDNLYGYTVELTGSAAKTSAIEMFRADGTPIGDRAYADRTTENWSMDLFYTVLRGGEEVYIISDEVGKLPSAPVYLLVQPAPKTSKPFITNEVFEDTTLITGFYEGPSVVHHRATAIMVVNDNNQAIAVVYLEDDGTFSINLSNLNVVKGQTLKIVAKEYLKEPSDIVEVIVH